MLDWLSPRQWTLSDVLTLAGLILAIVIAVFGPTRRWVGRLVRGGLLRAGRPERRYASWFVGKWGEYENPYLADTEKLDLSSTYVSLSFLGPNQRQETRTVATRLLADRQSGNLIIEGAPGSGKSTLLKAYGVGALRWRGGLRRHPGQRDIPFFVQLRKLARDLSKGGGLAKYLIDQVLVSGAGMTRADAAEFLQYALTEGRALVMLDGLDEVTADRYPAVLEAVHTFANDHNPQRPTYRARLIVTCRRQNFLALRDEWVPVIAETVCTLAPLRNSEIFSYLDKLRAKFRTSGGPESFFNAVRASGTLDLHRIPLILAMSVGLYARKDFFEIPGSIAKLYQTMIEEMLDRQRFKRDPGGSALVFGVGDKYRFLREFALQRAVSTGGFDDFERKHLLECARTLAPDLDAVHDPDAFVKEIIDRSGLLSDVSEAGRYVFAHRSIHEHLAAEELRLLPDGAAALLDRADDAEWRQVILFYATGLEQRSADAFLRRLAGRNVTLAGHCLAGAKASDGVAGAILDSLLTPDPPHLAALVAATTSPRRAVQQMAVTRLENQLLQSLAVVTSAFSGDVDGMLPLLGSLAGSNAGRIAALVPKIVAHIPDDPRLVEPLWRCLAAPGIEDEPACRTIVERLLTIAMDPDGLDDLQKQEPYARSFLTKRVRWEAYPFSAALPRSSNLVTLLAWAEHLGVVPAQPNRYFEAKAAGRLARVETDKRRTLSFSLFPLGRVMSTAGTVLSTVAAAALIAADWHVLLRPYGWWSPALSVGTGIAAFALWVVALLLGDGSRALRYFDSTAAGGAGGHISDFVSSSTLQIFAGLCGPVAFTILVLPLAARSLPVYLAAAIIVPFVLFWLPLCDLFARTTRFYPYRPNEYIDMYEDPRSRGWLVPGAANIVAAGAMAVDDEESATDALLR